MKLFLGALAGIFGFWLVLNLLGALIVGAIARAVLPGRQEVGWPTTIAVGFLGGIVGKILFAILGWPTHWGMGFVASVTGAFLLLLLHHFFVAGKAKPAA
jgi:uncharacterized membrane protein YeaQ/YmgE (transglycosylase-associated protein family)